MLVLVINVTSDAADGAAGGGGGAADKLCYRDWRSLWLHRKWIFILEILLKTTSAFLNRLKTIQPTVAGIADQVKQYAIMSGTYRVINNSNEKRAAWTVCNFLPFS